MHAINWNPWCCCHIFDESFSVLPHIVAIHVGNVLKYVAIDFIFITEHLEHIGINYTSENNQTDGRSVQTLDANIYKKLQQYYITKDNYLKEFLVIFDGVVVYRCRHKNFCVIPQRIIWHKPCWGWHWSLHGASSQWVDNKHTQVVSCNAEKNLLQICYEPYWFSKNPRIGIVHILNSNIISPVLSEVNAPSLSTFMSNFFVNISLHCNQLPEAISLMILTAPPSGPAMSMYELMYLFFQLWLWWLSMYVMYRFPRECPIMTTFLFPFLVYVSSTNFFKLFKNSWFSSEIVKNWRMYCTKKYFYFNFVKHGDLCDHESNDNKPNLMQ